MTKNRSWLLTFAAVGLAAGIAVSAITVYIDPYMHYHKPRTDKYFYTLSNERSQNDGITKHFDYDAVITGASITENFKTSQADELFGVHSIKVPYSGGSSREINDNLTVALQTHPDLKLVIRSLSRYSFVANKDALREDMGTYPSYLYDRNPFNDVQYLFNRHVLYAIDHSMIAGRRDGAAPGISSFDVYANWMDSYTFGCNAVLHTNFPNDDDYAKGFRVAKTQVTLSDADKQLIYDNVTQNVTDLADQYPDTTFYYFISPYSAVYWGNLLKQGTFERQIQLEKYAASLILPHKNIHLFMWNRFDLLDDLNNFKDNIHYAEWINTWMLVQMKQDVGRLTEENYLAAFDEEAEHYRNFDYSSLFRQTDYEADLYAAGLLNEEISGLAPVALDKEKLPSLVHGATVLPDAYEGAAGILCRGAMERSTRGPDLADAMYAGDFGGLRYTFNASGRVALTWYGRKLKDHGQPTVYIYDADGNILRCDKADYPTLDDQWHQHALSLDGLEGEVTVIMNGAYVDSTGSPESEYVFADIVLY